MFEELDQWDMHDVNSLISSPVPRTHVDSATFACLEAAPELMAGNTRGQTVTRLNQGSHAVFSSLLAITFA